MRRRGAVKRAFGCAALAPVSPRDLRRPLVGPCQSRHSVGGSVGHPFPPYAALRRERDIGEQWSFALERGHRIPDWSVLDVPGATPKKPASGLIARRRPSAPAPHPGESSPIGPDFPALRTPLGGIIMAKLVLPQALGTQPQRKFFAPSGFSHADNEHVLRHPAFIVRDVGSDAQGETLLAEQGISSVTGAVGPDLAALSRSVGWDLGFRFEPP